MKAVAPMFRPPCTNAATQRGFTLIELLVTLVLMGVMLVLAAPSFITFQRNSQLTSTANSFLASLSAARAEAMKRQLRTFVIPVDGSNWSSGWTVFVDSNSTVSASALSMDSGDVLLSSADALPSSITIDTTSATSFVHSGVKYVMFNGSGFMTLIGGGFPTSGADSLDFTSGAETRRVLASVAGRVRVCKPTDAGCSVSAGF
jgi:type IV fimbrial biogenesis protein FimT